ncbi:hypothetical protein [Maribacter sp. R86514]|uniref:hypothetical protein n=1 Tax=Maribacter sp. R86514 TaxID=3093854 RepID=UPI0037C52B9A
MKKTYFIGILLFCIILSCNKNEPETTLQEVYSFEFKINKDFLDFPTRDDYEKALNRLGQMSTQELEEWSNTVGFKSMQITLTESERESLGIYDDLLATLINSKGQIKIGDYILNLDAIEEKVYANQIDKNNSEILSSKSSKTFSINDNVLDILEGNEEETISLRSSYCDKSKISWNLDFNSLPNKIHAKVVYQKAGFLNSLQSKIEEEFFSGDSNWRMFLKTNGTNNFWINKITNGNIGPYESTIFNKANKSYRPYYSSRRLKDYNFSIEFWAQSETDNILRKKTITINCN